MFHRVMRSASRFVLAVMVITFLSPALGWHALATHDELEHGAVNVGAAHTHHHDSQNNHDESEAHGFIGHVLGHLPGCLSASLTVPESVAASSVCPYTAIAWPRISPDPPLRPPRFS